MNSDFCGHSPCRCTYTREDLSSAMVFRELKPTEQHIPSTHLYLNKMFSGFFHLNLIAQTIATFTLPATPPQGFQNIPVPLVTSPPSVEGRNHYPSDPNNIQAQKILAPYPKIYGDYLIVHCSSCGREDRERPGQCQKLNPIGCRCKCRSLKLKKNR